MASTAANAHHHQPHHQTGNASSSNAVALGQFQTRDTGKKRAAENDMLQLVPTR